MIHRIHIFLVFMLCLIAVATAGCSEDTGCTSSAECPVGQVCNAGFCEIPAPGDIGDSSNDAATSLDSLEPDFEEDTGPTDAGTNENDTQLPIEDVADSQPPTDTQISDTANDSTPDPIDVSRQQDTHTPGKPGPPQVVSVDPGEGQTEVTIPFVVVITFSEPIRPETVDNNTVQLLDIANKPIGGPPVLAQDGLSITLSPQASVLHHVSPYTVRVDPVVQDLEGNQLGTEFKSSFFTGAPAGWDDYVTLAALYAPAIWQTLSFDLPQYDYPVAFDADGNQQTADNPTWIQGKAKSLSPTVYWDVAETKSHWVFTYTLFYPYRDPAGAGGKPIANDTSGVMIVVQKYPEPIPVAAVTYGRRGDIQDMFAYVVSGSPLDGKPLVDDKGPSETLFPDGRFALYVTSPLHQACSWALGGPGECELNAGIKIGQSYLTMTTPSEEPTVVQKDGKWPNSLENATYQLRSGVIEWWSRRNQFGDTKVWAAGFDFNYEPEAGRPGGNLKELPSFFGLNVGTEGGRPPWSWSWKPSSFGQFTKLAQGTPFLDPAWFLSKRFGLGNSWNSAEKTGFSTDYCFHPTLDIDNRTTEPDCQ